MKFKIPCFKTECNKYCANRWHEALTIFLIFMCPLLILTIAFINYIDLKEAT